MTSFGLPSMSQQAASEVKHYLARAVAASEHTKRQPEEIKHFLDQDVLPELQELHTPATNVEMALQRCPQCFNKGLIAHALESAATAATLASNDSERDMIVDHLQSMAEPLRTARRWKDLTALHDVLLSVAKSHENSEDEIRRWVGLSWSAAGGECHTKEHFQDALDAYTAAEAVFRTLSGVDVDLAHCLHGRGVVLAELGKPNDALTSYREAEALYRQAGEPISSLAECLHAQGVAHQTMGHTADAGKAFAESENIANSPILQMFPQQTHTKSEAS